MEDYQTSKTDINISPRQTPLPPLLQRSSGLKHTRQTGDAHCHHSFITQDHVQVLLGNIGTPRLPCAVNPVDGDHLSRFFPFSTSFRAMEQTSSRSLLTQVEDPTTLSSVDPVLHALPTSTTQPHPLRLLSDSAAPQYQQWERELHPDREHPLTRLELALAEVQQCSGSESDVPFCILDNGSTTETGRRPTRSLSVLEKVSRFERRERAGKQRSHSTCNSVNNVAPLRVTQIPHVIGSDTETDGFKENNNGL